MDVLEIVAIGIAIIAVGIAFWQGVLAKEQLKQAKETKSETEKLLLEINLKVNKIETLSNSMREDMKNQVSKLIDNQDSNFKMLLKPSNDEGTELAKAMIPEIMKDPKLFKEMMKISKQK